MKGVLRIIVATVTIGIIFSNAYADCENDYIKSKTSDGSALVLSDGTIWEVDPTDRIDTALWSPLDDVLVCDGDSIIHKNNGEKVGATLVR